MEPDNYNPYRDYEPYYDDVDRRLPQRDYSAPRELPRYILEKDHFRTIDRLEDEFQRYMAAAHQIERANAQQIMELQLARGLMEGQLAELREPKAVIDTLREQNVALQVANKELSQRVAVLEEQLNVAMGERDDVRESARRLDIGVDCFTKIREDQPSCGNCRVCLRHQISQLRTQLEKREADETERLSSTQPLAARRVTFLTR